MKSINHPLYTLKSFAFLTATIKKMFAHEHASPLGKLDKVYIIDPADPISVSFNCGDNYAYFYVDLREGKAWAGGRDKPKKIPLAKEDVVGKFWKIFNKEIAKINLRAELEVFKTYRCYQYPHDMFTKEDKADHRLYDNLNYALRLSMHGLKRGDPVLFKNGRNWNKGTFARVIKRDHSLPGINDSINMWAVSFYGRINERYDDEVLPYLVGSTVTNPLMKKRNVKPYYGAELKIGKSYRHGKDYVFKVLSRKLRADSVGSRAYSYEVQFTTAPKKAEYGPKRNSKHIFDGRCGWCADSRPAA